MILFQFALIIGVLTACALTNCPINDNPKQIVDCLRYLTSGLYGAAINDVKMICDVAVDIARCTREELGDCIAAEISRAVLNEITSLAQHCCPIRNSTNCPIRNGLFDQQRCFAADSFVTLADGKRKQITELQSGDAILAYNYRTKKVISTRVVTMLDHQPNQFAVFKQLTTVSGQQLSLTSLHLLPTAGHGYLMAKNIRAGMNIFVMNDDGVLINETISNVIDIVKQGYIAPLTEEGTLIVNHVAASCYAAVDSHHVAHAALAPMRWWYGLFGEEKSSVEIVGIHWFPKMLYEMATLFMPSIVHKY